MAIRDGERLRQLVNDYYHGLLTEESYREQRGSLLDNLGTESVERSDTVTSEQRSAPGKSAKSQLSPATADKSSGTGFRPRSLVIGAVVLGGIAVGAFMVFVPGPGTGPATDETAGRGEVVEERSSNFGDSLIEDFLNRADWSADSLNNFLLAWNSLDDAERQRSTEGRHYRRLRIRLHQRIREEAVLSDAASNTQMQALTDFAAKIGAPYRESRTVATDEMAIPDVLPGVDVKSETEVVPTDGDFAAVVLIEDEAAPTQSDQPAAVPTSESDQPADEAVVCRSLDRVFHSRR